MRRSVGLGLILMAVCCCSMLLVHDGCQKRGEGETGRDTLMARRDINSVKESHSAELMAIPGVVGVYVGETENRQPCIGVMVVKKTPELEKMIPKILEGYPVKVDETGIIKPMR